MAGDGPNAGTEVVAWGARESAATTLLFSAPALIVLARMNNELLPAAVAVEFSPGDWAITGAGLAGGFALSLLGRGAVTARLYLTTGLASCVAWLVFGVERRAAADDL